MSDWVRWLCVVMGAIGFAACGSVGPPVVEGVSDAQSIDASSPPPAPSCLALPYTCGANGNDSCCRSLGIAGGTYDRSYDLAADSNSGDKSYPASISNFRLDKYEVTVGRFRAFVAEEMGTQANHPAVGAGTHANIPGSGWEANWNTGLAMDTAALVAAVKCDPMFQTWTDAPGGDENRPMNCITWYEAMAFCAWDGGYLPTEAEWNYAAAGGEQQRAYPWSDLVLPLALDSSHASYNDGTNCVGDGLPGCTLTDLVLVGTKPAGDGRWGQSDLAGNVYEWMLDWQANYATTCTDCADLSAATYRVVRGGCFNFSMLSLRTGNRGDYPPAGRGRHIGVRCARSAL